MQRTLFAVLAPIARLRGLHGRYPRSEQHTGPTVDELEALPPEIAALPRGNGDHARRPPVRLIAGASATTATALGRSRSSVVEPWSWRDCGSSRSR